MLLYTATNLTDAGRAMKIIQAGIGTRLKPQVLRHLKRRIVNKASVDGPEGLHILASCQGTCARSSTRRPWSEESRLIPSMFFSFHQHTRIIVGDADKERPPRLSPYLLPGKGIAALRTAAAILTTRLDSSPARLAAEVTFTPGGMTCAPNCDIEAPLK